MTAATLNGGTLDQRRERDAERQQQRQARPTVVDDETPTNPEPTPATSQKEPESGPVRLVVTLGEPRPGCRTLNVAPATTDDGRRLDALLRDARATAARELEEVRKRFWADGGEGARLRLTESRVAAYREQSNDARRRSQAAAEKARQLILAGAPDAEIAAARKEDMTASGEARDHDERAEILAAEVDKLRLRARESLHAELAATVAAGTEATKEGRLYGLDGTHHKRLDDLAALIVEPLVVHLVASSLHAGWCDMQTPGPRERTPVDELVRDSFPAPKTR